jgi:putative Mg2+ transporter-C (MgtC) family protein
MDTVFSQIASVIAAEFSDLANIEQFVQMTVRLLMAAFLGAIVGFERQYHQKNAGVRTHTLVALGSALFIIIPIQTGVTTTDLSRIIQGLITGIGFLGAGIIVYSDKERRVRGLTSAAGIWLTAAIGTAAGSGREASALLATVLTLSVLTLLRRTTMRVDDDELASSQPDSRF